MSLLEINKLAFDYGKNEILNDINFTIGKGEIFCVLGPNGCGKTTLLDCVLGLLHYKKGEIFLNGEAMAHMLPQDIAKQIAYVPQSHEKTFPYTVLDIVLMGRAAHIGMFSSPAVADVQMAEKALETVGITRLKQRRYTELSGGEGQLVMIARALAQNTPLIVMDEPTAHLDFKHELVVMETIVQLVRDTGRSILMATHFPNHCFYFENNNLPTQVALMKENTFITVGKPVDVLSEENLRKIYQVNTRIISCPTAEDRELKQVVAISTVT